MKRRIKKWVIRPLIILISSLIVVAAIGFTILSTQQQRLVNLAVGELNKQFKGELSTGESSVSLFRDSSLGYIQISGKQSLDMSMEYYVRVPMKMVTKIGFSALFNRKQEEVDLNQVDQIEYIDKDRKIAFMNLKVTGTPDGNFDVGLGRQPKNKK